MPQRKTVILHFVKKNESFSFDSKICLLNYQLGACRLDISGFEGETCVNAVPATVKSLGADL
jgi:hypothetical protein